jgi:hypothetical protein
MDKQKKDKESKDHLSGKDNTEMIQEIYDMVEYMKKYTIRRQVFGFLKLFIIIIPLVLGFLYLPPFIEKMTGNYKDWIKESGIINIPNIENITEIKKDPESFWDSLSEQEKAELREYIMSQ